MSLMFHLLTWGVHDMPDNWSRWGENAAGTEYGGITLHNESLEVVITNAGASIVSVSVPDQNGKWGNVAVSAVEHEDYLTNPSFLGATAGRFANRIANGKFTLDGKEYTLAVNNGPNHLHGGIVSFAHQVWETVDINSDVATFRLISPDGQEGYPGELTTQLTYRLDGQDLVLEYKATTDAPTVLNLTNHTYWNLAGDGKIYDHVLQLNADRFLENDADVLPTGKILDVAGTPWDFRTPKRIGKEIADVPGGGYDSCFLINDADGTLRTAAKVTEPTTGRTLEILTTEPGIQLYSAIHFNGSRGTAGKEKHTSFCLECQHLPDAPNHPEFGSTVLRPGDVYSQTTIHRFGVA